MVDKYLAKEYVANIIGKQYVIPLYGVWDKLEDVDFASLPNQFVLKWNHDSGSVILCKDKNKLNIEDVRRKLERGTNYSGFWYGREWPYKHVVPKLIAEQYMEDSLECGQLSDYKIHCFNGEPKVIQVITDRFSENGMINDHYYPSWRKLDLVRGDFVSNTKSIPRPKELDEMLELAKILSAGIPYLRTDFYIVDQRIYFGELTFFPASGFTPFHPEKWDQVWGQWIKLPTDGLEK